VNHIIFLALAAFVFGIAAITRMSGRTTKAHNASAYQAKASLLSPAELHFKKTLDAAIPSTATIMAQVGLEEIIHVKTSIRGKDWARARGKIKARRIDFVVCDRETYKILCAIELNDHSHARADRKIRDAFIREALAGANIPLIEVACKNTYDSTALGAQIAPAITRHAA
jgi:hypothetical protein